MRIDILSPLPHLLKAPFSTSILAKAIEKKIIEIHIHDLRDYTKSDKKQIDDYSYGGGGGMVLMIEPIARCINKLQSSRDYDSVIFMTPEGKKLTQNICNQLSQEKNIIILCGRYEGIDQRIRDIFINKEISIGDYVLTGGELPALVLCDCIIRLLPGSMSNSSCALSDSFQDNLLAPPIYTRPCNYHGHKVPDVLLSGNNKKISEWRDEQSYVKTKKNRPDLLEK
ncbi:MAG: tRNA (guanosine(37)-N1)-methyltransferase TrmD [Flavobacteriales bacterium]|jgi:tRNA (guanine37-N1)-methyltransferase|nr:tRNA (guanosine(37)-N1)-methyltransferase TrmD [Flavobacteriales bacterium]|tara:strand:+ start:11307 stop:11984 length:678 start_codon:yes stop_codon:yes gene_type:complete